MPAARENIPAVIDFVNRELKSVGCPMKTEAQIDIAIDELYSNIANYGYDGEKEPAARGCPWPLFMIPSLPSITLGSCRARSTSASFMT